MIRVASRVDPQKTRFGSRVNPFLLRIKKIGFGSSQKILTRFTMSTNAYIEGACFIFVFLIGEGTCFRS